MRFVNGHERMMGELVRGSLGDGSMDPSLSTLYAFFFLSEV